MESKAMYLLNTNSRKIHLSNSVDGRCKIKSMREEYKKYFNSLDDALNFPSPDSPLAKKCIFCFQKD